MPRKPKKPTPKQPKPLIIIDDSPLDESDERFMVNADEIGLISDPATKAMIIADYRKRMATPPGQPVPEPSYRRRPGGDVTQPPPPPEPEPVATNTEWRYYAEIGLTRKVDNPHSVFRFAEGELEQWRWGMGWVSMPSMLRFVYGYDDGADEITLEQANKLTGGSALVPASTPLEWYTQTQQREQQRYQQRDDARHVGGVTTTGVWREEHGHLATMVGPKPARCPACDRRVLAGNNPDKIRKSAAWKADKIALLQPHADDGVIDGWNGECPCGASLVIRNGR